jgi:hypothetical protein
VEHWKLSKDPLFVEKVKDIVGLYLDPPEVADRQAAEASVCGGERAG